MDAKLKILWFLIDLALPLGVGFALHQVGWLTRELGDRIIKTDIRVMGTAVSLVSFWAADLTLEMIWLPVLGVAMQVIPGAVGGPLARRKYEGRLEQGGFVLTTMLSNRGVVGSLAVFILFGEQGYVWARLVMLLAPLVLFLVCFPLAQRYRDSHTGDGGAAPGLLSAIVSWNQLPVAGIAAGFALNLGSVARPEAVGAALPWMVHAMAWGVVMPLGASLNFGLIARFVPDLAELLALKFLVTPVLVGVLAYAVGLRGDVLACVTILAASPTAIMAVVTARLHGLNVDLTMAGFVVSTVIYILLIFPALLWWLG